MFLNNILELSQKTLGKVCEGSVFVKNIDLFIFFNLIFMIFSFAFATLDSISYFAIVMIILTLVKLFVKSGEKFFISGCDKFLLLYFIFVVISLFGSSLFLLSLKGFMKTVIYLSFYVSLIHFFKDNKDKIKYVFYAILFVVGFESVVAFLQNFASIGEISGWQDTSRLNPEEIMTRVYGTIKPYNPNLFGGFMLATVPAGITLINEKKNIRIISLLVIFAGLLSIIFTGCRGAYIGCFFQIAVLLLILYKFLKPVYKKVFTFLVSVGFMLITSVVLSLSALRARILSIFAMRNDSSNSFRFNVYNSCVDMFKDNWLLGIGIGNQNFREIYGLYMKTGFDALSAYNIYLEIAVESGIFALVAFLSFIFLILKNAIRYIFTEENFSRMYVLAALISVIGILIHGFVDTVFFRPQIQFTFWIMTAIMRSHE